MSKKVSDWYQTKFGIKKNIGFGFGKSLVSEKVSDSVLFRSGVSSHTAVQCTGLKMIELTMLIYYGGITTMMMIYLRRLSLLGGMSGVEQVGRQIKHLIGGNSQFLMKIMMKMMRSKMVIVMLIIVVITVKIAIAHLGTWVRSASRVSDP